MFFTSAGKIPIWKCLEYCRILLSDSFQLVNHYHPEVAEEVYVFFLLMCFCFRFWLRRWEFLNHSILVSIQVRRIYCVSNRLLNHFLFHNFSLGLEFSFSHIIITGCSTLWKEVDRRIATLEFDRDRKSMGVIVNTGAGKNSLYVKVCCYIMQIYWWQLLAFSSTLHLIGNYWTYTRKIFSYIDSCNGAPIDPRKFYFLIIPYL